MIAAELDLTIHKGTTFYRSFIWKDEAGTPINMTGWSVEADVRKTTSSALAFTLGASITDASGGEFEFDISDEDTKALQAGTYYYDVIFDKGDGTRTEPVMSGSVTVTGIYSQA
jgi:hypothetical protein